MSSGSDVGSDQELFVSQAIGSGLLLWFAVIFSLGVVIRNSKGSSFEVFTCVRKGESNIVNLTVHFCKHLFFAPLHILRATETASADRRVYSSAEKAYLSEERNVFNDAIINFLAVRRSMLFVSVLLNLLSIAGSIQGISYALDSKRSWAELGDIDVDGKVMSLEQFLLRSGKPINLETLKEPESWMMYTRTLYLGIIARIMSVNATIEVIGAAVRLLCLSISGLCLLLASRRWPKFRSSSRVVMIAWACTIIAPFSVTLIPTRLFVDWSSLGPITRTYTMELSKHLGDTSSETAQKVVDICQSLIESRDREIHSVSTRLDKICKHLEKTPESRMKCCGVLKVVDFDFRPVHMYCRQIRTYLANPSGPLHRRAVALGANMCEKIVLPNAEDRLRMGFGDALTFATSAEPLAAKLQGSAEVFVGFLNGLQRFSSIAPASLALAPAMLRGALKVKVLAPQSSIPGMFVLLLPFLYCPLSWSLYHIYFQILGDIWMMMGLFIIACSPMMYPILGITYGITKPMSDIKVKSLITSMGRWSMLISIIGYLMLCKFLFTRYRRISLAEDSELSMQDEAWRYVKNKFQVLQLTNWIRILGSAMANFFLTTVAGTDWMMGEIGKQRRYEMLLEITEEMEELEESSESVKYPNGLHTEERRQEFKEVLEERSDRLDCVFYIVYDEPPMRIERNDDSSSTRIVMGPTKSLNKMKASTSEERGPQRSPNAKGKQKSKRSSIVAGSKRKSIPSAFTPQFSRPAAWSTGIEMTTAVATNGFSSTSWSPPMVSTQGHHSPRGLMQAVRFANVLPGNMSRVPSDHHHLQPVIHTHSSSDHHHLQPMTHTYSSSDHHHLQPMIHTGSSSDFHSLQPMTHTTSLRSPRARFP